MHQVNQLSEAIFSNELLSYYHAPTEHIQEAFGVEYPYRQAGKEFSSSRLQQKIFTAMDDIMYKIDVN